MRLLITLAVASLLYSCSQPSSSPSGSVPNALLESEVNAVKDLFYQRNSGNPKAYLLAWDKMQHFDREFENLIANCATVTNTSAIKDQLDVCAEAAMDVSWPNQDLQNRIYTEVFNIKNNLASFDSVSLKERLLTIQLIYWNEFSSWPIKNNACVDTVGNYVVNTQGKSGEVYATPIAAIAYYTADNYRVLIGDFFNPDGSLGGNVREITLQSEHMPVYTDSTATRGHHKVPAQLIYRRADGKADTNNFYIEYDIK